MSQSNGSDENALRIDREVVARYLAYIGSKGGTARWAGVGKEMRRRHAKMAARARWGRRKRKGRKP